MLTQRVLHSNCLQCKRLSTQKLSLFVSLMGRSPQTCNVCYSAQCVFCSVRCHCIFYDPVSDTIRWRCGYRGIFREERFDTGAYFRRINGYRVKKSQKCIICRLEQAGAKVCWMGYQNSNFKIGLSLFGCAEKILNKVHIVHCYYHPRMATLRCVSCS